MTCAEVIRGVETAFGDVPRPARFNRGSCDCAECREHEETMQSFTPENLPLDLVDNPGWDPICFASDEAFAYLMPGLVRLVLEHTADYCEQFLFHLDNAERVASFTPPQAEALLAVLEFLVMDRTETVDDGAWGADVLYRIRDRLRLHIGAR
jgi:hypothetical protein